MRVYHWWPGRTWDGPCPHIVEKYVPRAEELGSKYMTIAVQWLGDPDNYLIGMSLCCKKDNPSRSLGRKIAVARLYNAWGKEIDRSCNCDCRA
jgi:hypothetical protein